MKSRYTLLKINSSDDYLSWVDPLNGTRLFALFDAQSKLTRLDEIESGRWGPAINLYGDLEGTRIAQLGPRIIEANDTGSRPELVELAFSTRASLLAGNCTLEEIAIHLKDLREIALPDGTPALFRFQDARVAVATFPTLNPAQGCKLLGPLTAWAVLDVCHRLHVRSGARQDSCRLIHAAKGCLSVARDVISTTESRSGLSVTTPMGSQLRVWRDQRFGFRCRASAYSACRAARIARSSPAWRCAGLT